MTFDIKKMLSPDVFDHPVEQIELIETHISWVILTGKYAYKIKKPVNFGFLDFSTLEKRKKFCEQELTLNRKLASEIYLDVVSINNSAHNPIISSNGKAVEYAVKMRQFPQSAQLDNRLTAGKLTLKNIDAIAQMIAHFHGTTEIADSSMNFGNSIIVNHAVEENFLQIRQHLHTHDYETRLTALSQWSETEEKKLQNTFTQRKSDGFIRQCHGDMHLRNMLWLHDKPMAFDCIEFNPELSWIDVISEIAFLVMDCQYRQQPQLANRFLNSYLEATGDYKGIEVLPYYLCYRAMVRAKVNILRYEQAGISNEEKQKAVVEFESYIDLATSYTQPKATRLIIMRGMSASGKSTISQQLVDTLGIIRIRSDVERKRLFGVTTNSQNNIDSGIYSAQASEKTYDKLAKLAASIINAGYSVIIDAAFLKYKQRQVFQQLAEHLNISFVILEILASAETLRQRIKQRKNDISDADLNVLNHQLESHQPLHQDEQTKMISINTEEPVHLNQLINKITAI